jgi:hypothetical protein
MNRHIITHNNTEICIVRQFYELDFNRLVELSSQYEYLVVFYPYPHNTIVDKLIAKLVGVDFGYYAARLSDDCALEFGIVDSVGITPNCISLDFRGIVFDIHYQELDGCVLVELPSSLLDLFEPHELGALLPINQIFNNISNTIIYKYENDSHDIESYLFDIITRLYARGKYHKDNHTYYSRYLTPAKIKAIID